MRLSMGHIVGSNQHFGNWQSAVLQAVSGKQPRTRSNDSPLPGRNRSQQVNGTWHDGNSTLIVRFVVFNRVGLSLNIEMRRHAPDHFDRAHTMRDGHDRVAIDTFARGPFAPLAIYRARRVNKNSV